jgi:hypothetical protein
MLGFDPAATLIPRCASLGRINLYSRGKQFFSSCCCLSAAFVFKLIPPITESSSSSSQPRSSRCHPHRAFTAAHRFAATTYLLPSSCGSSSCVGEVAFTDRLQCLVGPHMGLYDSFLWAAVLVCGFYYLSFSFINFYRLATSGATFVFAVLAATCAASFCSLYAIQI